MRINIHTTRNKKDTEGKDLSAGLLEVGNQIVSVLGLLEATESHLGAGNVLLGVLEVLVHGVLGPDNTLLLVGLGVRVSGSVAGLSAKDTVEVGTDLVSTTGLGGVALETSGLEKVGTLLSVTCGNFVRRHDKETVAAM